MPDRSRLSLSVVATAEAAFTVGVEGVDSTVEVDFTLAAHSAAVLAVRSAAEAPSGVKLAFAVAAHFAVAAGSVAAHFVAAPSVQASAAFEAEPSAEASEAIASAVGAGADEAGVGVVGAGDGV